jgi:hypothetical protein
MAENHDKALGKIVNERHQTCWVNPEKADKRETLGLVIASFSKWNINDIAVSFLQALEDANAHTERAHIADYLKGRGFDVKA